MELLLLGVNVGRVSVYFLMKNYYALWIIAIYMSFKGLMYIFEKSKIKAALMLGVYALIIIVSLIFIDAKILISNVNPYENPLNVAEIFGVNKTFIFNREEDLNLKELDILKYAKENIDFDNNAVEYLMDEQQTYWTYSLLREINYEEYMDELAPQDKLLIKSLMVKHKIGKVDYIIYLRRSENYTINEAKLFQNGEIIYENEAGGIIKYKK